MLKNYFEEKVGEKLHKNYITGERLFTETYKRHYSLEVIGIENNQVALRIKSFDITPSGMRKADTDKNFGTCKIELEKDVDNILEKACRKVDKEFFSKYNL